MGIPKNYEKSFASSVKSKFWSKKNELIPEQVYKSTINKFWFDCNICKHEFYSSLLNIKMKWALENGYSVIRICQEDVYYNFFY